MSEQRPYLDADPPPWAAHALAWMVLAITGIALLVSILLTVPETVSATFTLVPVRGADPVKALRAGVVREAHVTTGQQVAAGALLFAIAAPEAADRAGELRGIERELSDAAASLDNLRRTYDAQRSTDQQERSRLVVRQQALEAQLAIRKRQVAIAEEIRNRYRESNREGLSAVIETTRAESDVARLQAEVSVNEGERADVASTLLRLDREMAEREAAWRERLRAVTEGSDKSRIRRAVLADDPATGGIQRIVAPCTGTIVEARVVQAGTVVDEGATLADLACADERLQARLSLPQRGLGRVRAGQPVKLLYDAFPYERYGAAPATLTWVSPAGALQGGEPFSAFAALQHGGPMARALGPGMSGRADVIVGRRRLIAYLIDPLRQLREDLR